MNYPILSDIPSSRGMIGTFAGYNHNLVINEGEFFDMKNLTSDHFPLLSPRGKRGVFAEPDSPQGMIAKDSLCYVDGRYFVINSYRVDMGLSTDDSKCPKQLISMGAYVIIMPDKMYINTEDLTDFGPIEASFTSTTDVTFSLCNMDGVDYNDVSCGAIEPANPENQEYWVDTSCTPHTLKSWSANTDMWVSVPTTYIRIGAAGIGTAFKQYDGVRISGINIPALSDLNANMIVWERGDDHIVVVGILDEQVTQTLESGAITVTRRMPNMDFITECNNRLWGCRYGTDGDGNVVNEIYACKLGDFKNWNCFMGLSTDSYVASCGTDGRWTGAITHLGYPVFWKENFLHKVYGNYPSNFQIQSTACRGVQKGSSKSLAIVNEVVYYMGRNGVCVYDGSLPVEISKAFGELRYTDAVAGGHNNKYYVSAKDESGEYHLFVYDTKAGQWHKEDNTQVDEFCACRGEMYFIDHADNKIKTVFGTGEVEEGPIEWMAETGVIGTSEPDKKYVARMLIRMSMELGSKIDGWIQYDSNGRWERIFTVKCKVLRTFNIPIRPKRCDHFRLRFAGVGDAKIYSITKTLEQGSDV